MQPFWNRLFAHPPAGPEGQVASPPPPHPDAAFQALIAPLPEAARRELTRHTLVTWPLPQDAAALFALVHAWMVGAGIAEGRGGYPGGRGKPGWLEYVEDQARNIATFNALVDAFGEPSPSLMASLREYEQAFPPPVRRMGEGTEPHVDDVAGRLIYAIPVDNGLANVSFFFPIVQPDLDVLLADPWRRAVLEAAAHAMLKHSMIPGAAEVTEMDFARLKGAALHSTPEALQGFITSWSKSHSVDLETSARQALDRRSAR